MDKFVKFGLRIPLSLSLFSLSLSFSVLSPPLIDKASEPAALIPKQNPNKSKQKKVSDSLSSTDVDSISRAVKMIIRNTVRETPISGEVQEFELELGHQQRKDKENATPTRVIGRYRNCQARPNRVMSSMESHANPPIGVVQEQTRYADID